MNRRARVRTLLGRTGAKAWHDRILGLSAEAAFWQLLSLPSLALAGLASLGYASRWFGAGTVDRTESQLEATFARAFSPDIVAQVVSPTLREVLRGHRIDIISIGFGLALWAGSSATATFVNTITIAYDMRDQRGAIRSRMLALGLFLGSVLVGVILLPMLVLGPDVLSDLFPPRSRDTASEIIHDAYYPGVVTLILLGLTTLYHLAPPRRLPWRRGVPGALLAVVVFLAGSVALRAYIRFILDNNHAYGSLAAPIAALLFFYVLAFGVLLGAEFNAAIEYLWPSRARRPRVLHPRSWRRLSDDHEPAPGGEAPDVAVAVPPSPATGPVLPPAVGTVSPSQDITSAGRAGPAQGSRAPLRRQ